MCCCSSTAFRNIYIFVRYSETLSRMGSQLNATAGQVTHIKYSKKTHRKLYRNNKKKQFLYAKNAHTIIEICCNRLDISKSTKM